MTASVHSSMRIFEVIAAMVMLFTVVSNLLLWTPIPCLEPSTALAVAQSTSWPAMQITRVPPTKEPPASAGGLQFRWDYSDLACTGPAAQPQRTGIVEKRNGVDHDQLSVRVELQNCFKGTRRAGEVTVLGDSVFAARIRRAALFVPAHPLAWLPQAATCYSCAPPDHRLYGE